MSVNSFKFVSPGVFVNEVDNSQLPRLPDATGPVIIGRAERGPAMVPVQVNSFSEFVETFGEPIAGAQSDDAWRQGNRIGPTYGAFAAQAYLKNGSPVTFVRLLGHAHESATPQGAAGWEMTAAWALKVGINGAADKLAAIIYTNNADGSALAALDAGEPTNGIIKLDIKKPGAGTPATAATSRIVIKDNFTADDLTDNTATITIEKAIHKLGVDSDLTVKFDKSVSTHSYNTLTAILLVGTNGVPDNDEVALSNRLRDAFNGTDNEIAISATSQNGVLIVTRDYAGLTNDFVTTNPAADAAIETADDTDGTAALPGADSSSNFAFSFDTGSTNYIRNILNTNPTLTNDDITKEPEHYFLGATFDQFLKSEHGSSEINKFSVTKIAAFQTNRKDATPSSSPWLMSQYMGDNAELAAPISTGDLTKLFKLHSLYAGEWEQKNFKISVVDIKPPTSSYIKYGTFSLLVRAASDNDAAPVVFERFSNMNLDPTSPRYIAAVIGDTEHQWRADEKRYVQVGEYENKSRYLRVEMASEVASGAANPQALPFGYAIPGHSDEASGGEPNFFLRLNTSGDATLSSAKSAFFGISTDVPTSPGRFDESYQDIVRPLYKDDDMHQETSGLFTLDWVAEESGNANHAEYVQDGLRDGTSYNGISNDFSTVLTAGYDRFTLPLVGGFDGLDIKQIEPFSDLATDGSAIGNYAYNTISRAIDTVADPEVVECNLMTIPGVGNPGLTGKLVTTCEARADALAIIDLEGDYTPRGWNTDDEAARLPSVSDATSALKLRAMNSSYGCAFFPWVQVRDDINNRLIWMPPSVAALGTMASSSANSELWFAPAGFTRGGLSAGAAGIPVSQTRLRLSSKERDSLYEANINPIAQFPAEGIVIFGQKTLQVTPSALDRINVRRLMIHVKKEISRMAATVLFDQNVETTWNRFVSRAEPFLASIQTRFGLSEYRILLDNTTTTPELVDRNIVYAKIYLKPARAIEFIAIDFVITNSGASFDD